MEPDHPFVIARLAGVFLCALPAVRELYQYVNDPRYAPVTPFMLTTPPRQCAHRRAVRMGQHVWLLLATIGTELLAITKWSRGQFAAPLPKPVKWAWVIGGSLLLLYPTVQVCTIPCLTEVMFLCSSTVNPTPVWYSECKEVPEKTWTEDEG